MKKKIILSLLFMASLIPMFFNQYGGAKGVQEISGLNNLLNPIGVVSVLLFLVGIWYPFRNKSINKYLSSIGVIGIILSEIFVFLTWYIPLNMSTISLEYSLSNVLPEFYIGIVVSIAMVIVYFITNKRKNV